MELAAFSQEASANVAMHGMSGFGIYGVDVFVETDEAERAIQILEDMDVSIENEERFLTFSHMRANMIIDKECYR